MTQPPKKLVRPPGAANYLDTTTNYLAKRRCLGLPPEFVRIGRSIYYELSALDALIDAGRRKSTSDPGGGVS